MKLLLIGGIVGFIIAMCLAVLYLIFAKFFAAQARALDAKKKTTDVSQAAKAGN